MRLTFRRIDAQEHEVHIINGRDDVLVGRLTKGYHGWHWGGSLHFLRHGAPGWDAQEVIWRSTIDQVKKEVANRIFIALVGRLDFPARAQEAE